MPATEMWRRVPGASRYQVSDKGRVRSAKREMAQHRDAGGYARVGLVFDAGIRRRVKVSQLVARAFIGPQHSGMHVRHLDGDRANDSLPNLAYGTPQQNTQDSLRHGTHYEASKTHCTRGHELTPENIYVLSTRPTERRCRACDNQRSAKYRAKVPRSRRNRRAGDELCRHGHVIADVGLNAFGHCFACKREYMRQYRAAKRARAA